MIVTLSLADFIHPDRFGPMFKGSPPAWRLKRAVSERDIRCALERDDLVAEPYDTTTGVVPHRWHAGRIAYLVKHGWSDPIEVKVVDTTDWPLTTIINGSHRFRAAVYRGDEHIKLQGEGRSRPVRALDEHHALGDAEDRRSLSSCERGRRSMTLRRSLKNDRSSVSPLA